VSDFHQKQFEGTLYDFKHLQPIKLKLPLNSAATVNIDIDVSFGCHCFTEEFNPSKHLDHHRYTHKNELRAFDPTRYECSLQLPQVIQNMLRGRIYWADKSYTYVAMITLTSMAGSQNYSVFFSLEKNLQTAIPALRMFIKSAYLRPSVAKPNSQGWRFVSLAGQVAGVFAEKGKSGKPQKQKAP
jgi:hypothetical protein